MSINAETTSSRKTPKIMGCQKVVGKQPRYPLIHRSLKMRVLGLSVKTLWNMDQTAGILHVVSIALFIPNRPDFQTFLTS
jgi:hypothetical protein